MRLALVISSLARGGAEKVMAALANHWADEGHAVTLFTWDDGRTPPRFPLRASIAWKPLSLAASPAPLGATWRRWRRLRAAIRASGAQAVVSFLDQVNVMTLLATRGLRVSVAVSERVDPAVYPSRKIWRFLRWGAYVFADRVVVQTERARRYFPPWIRRRTVVIPNPVTAPEEGAALEGWTRPHLLAVGRLDAQKGFDILLRAFARLGARHPAWRLTILGEGPERVRLESLRGELGLEEKTRLPGAVDDVGPYLRQADLFVLSSRFEGFPNALAEAMAAGLPVVAADCPSGPAEIVRPGIDGLLAKSEDVGSLAAALDELMADPAARARLGQAARDVAARFSPEKIMAAWDRVLKDAVGARGSAPGAR